LFSTTSSATFTPSTSSNNRPKKRFLDILLQPSSTTEEDTEEEVSVPAGVKKTKRRRRNFSSSTSSSYSSSLTTISTANSSSCATTSKISKEAHNSKEVTKDLIAYRTRSRTQSIERGAFDLETASKPRLLVSRRKSRSSRTQLVSDTEIEKDKNQGQSKKSAEVSEKNLGKKRILENCPGSPQKTSVKLNRFNVSQSSCKYKEGVSRKLRSQTSGSQTPIAKNLQQQSASRVKPKRQNQNNQKSSAGCLTKLEGKEIGLNKFVNLGAKIACFQSRREVQHNPDRSAEITQTSSTSNPIETDHLPINSLRRSARGKGATTGSCVSIYLTCEFVFRITNYKIDFIF
jgi:hypothetical protein